MVFFYRKSIFPLYKSLVWAKIRACLIISLDSVFVFTSFLGITVANESKSTVKNEALILLHMLCQVTRRVNTTHAMRINTLAE